MAKNKILDYPLVEKPNDNKPRIEVYENEGKYDIKLISSSEEHNCTSSNISTNKEMVESISNMLYDKYLVEIYGSEYTVANKITSEVFNQLNTKEQKSKPKEITSDGTKDEKTYSRQEQANYIWASSKLNELVTNDISEEHWEELKDTYLEGRISFETWERYFKENKNIKEEEAKKYLTQDTKSLREQVLALFHDKHFGEGTELLVQEVNRNNYIYTTKVDKASEIYIYEEGIYVPEGESEIKRQLRVIMEESYSEWLANQVLAKIKTDTQISTEKFFKDVNIWQVPLQNGILDLKTLELSSFNPTKIFFNKLPVKYVEGEICEKIDKFLDDVLTCPEDKDVFYELAGFGLVKEYFLEKAFMLVGNGRNGKGKTIELAKRLVGTSNTAAVPLSAITSNSPFVQSLWKRFFNLAGDISSEDLKDTSMFKQLTGRDPISANRKYKNIVEFTNYAKMVFACNELPRVYDYSDGFWERWILLEFPYKFVDKDVYKNATVEERKMWKIKDPNIIEEITTPQEMSGFLNLALLGLHRLLKNKKFSYTKGTVEVKNKWIRKADSFMAFCMDCLEEDYDSKISKRELRNRYKHYCREHKIRGTSDKSIKISLQENFGASEDRIVEAISNLQEYCWSGIKWKETTCYPC